MTTPSAAAAANIFSAAAAVVLFSSAASPEVARRMAGRTRSGGTNVAGESGRCLLTITHGLVGFVSECCGPGAAADGGDAAADGGAAVAEGAAAAAAGDAGVAGAAVALAGSGEPDAEAAADCAALPLPGVGPGVGPGVPNGVLGWAGVQAVRAARPVPASRRRLNARRLGESGPASCRPEVSPPPL